LVSHQGSINFVQNYYYAVLACIYWPHFTKNYRRFCFWISQLCQL